MAYLYVYIYTHAHTHTHIYIYVYICKYLYTHTDTGIGDASSFIGHDSSLCVTHAHVGHGDDSFISVTTSASAASRFARGCENAPHVFPDTRLLLFSL